MPRKPNPEPPPTEQIDGRALDLANLLRYAGGLTDRHLHLTVVAARTYAAIEYEAGLKPAEQESWCEKACSLLLQLSAEDQEVIYWRIGTMLARPSKTTAKTPQAEAL